MTWQARIDAALRAREASHSLRRRVVCTPAPGGALVHQGVRYRNFSGNDYLGLSQHPALIAAWQQGAQTYGVGSGASGHVSGYSDAHQSLENALAQWLGFDRALLFISGFAANQAVVAALMQQSDRILADRLSHASLLEAASHSPATLRRFAHNDSGALAALLDKPCDGLTLVFTEGVFSMDGDSAPLADIAGIAQAAQTLMMVDDAHGVGVLGREGRGSCDVAGDPARSAAGDVWQSLRAQRRGALMQRADGGLSAANRAASHLQHRDARRPGLCAERGLNGYSRGRRLTRAACTQHCAVSRGRGVAAADACRFTDRHSATDCR